MDVFDSKNPVVISFGPFAGGRFLGNCLSLSKDFCPQNPLAAEYLLQHPTDYDYRLEVVLKSLPPPDKVHLWQKFEYRDQQLYGLRHFGFWIQGLKYKPNDITRKLCESTMRFLLNDHTMEPMGLCKVWTNATVVRLINSRRFQDISVHKKQSTTETDVSQFSGYYCVEKYNMVRSPQWPDWEEFQQCGYDVTKCRVSDQATIEQIGEFYRVHTLKNQVIIYDVDQSYFDPETFIHSMKSLYQNFGLIDFSLDLISLFYKKYISLHF